VRQPEVLAQALSLRALACPRWTEQYQVQLGHFGAAYPLAPE